ncbi:MAG TPA: nickel insertion protein, partial [Planctomycetota bacterium]|nr:nickel insertion protein [Planctomycetota bacterium]
PPEVPPDRYAYGERVTLVETNFDTATGQEVGDLIDRLFSRGVLDVWTTPIQMKKSRPGVKLSVLVQGSGVGTAMEILRNSPTFGVRFQNMARLILPREIKEVQTRFGAIRCKVGFMNDRAIRAAPEYEDVAAAARRAKVPFDVVHLAASEAGRRLLDE